MIYLSTGGFKNYTFKEAISHLAKEGINAFELSGGLFTKNLLDELKLLGSKYSLALHNYFPPPKIPFVFNLGSLNEFIAAKSIEHAKNAINCSSIVGSNYYSFHAGYLIDPMINELGQKINKRVINDRDESKRLFIDRVNHLSNFADKKNIKLMIENNVLSYKNFKEFGDNPLLMVDQEETHEVLNKTNKNVGLLIDVAHLKVSAKTLKFSRDEYMAEFKNKVFGYHFSENNGLEDSNEIITRESWFWELINKDVDYFSLEIYNEQPKALKQQIDLTKEMISI